jgi:hypothetical protein
MYVEILNSNIVTVHNQLPLSYNNISNFFALEPELLHDLSWSGNEGVKFYEYIEQRPEELPPGSKLVGPDYIIDNDNHTVTGTFEVVPIGPVPPVVPDTISARQIRLWLLQNGISLQMVNTAISNIEDPLLRDSVSIEWEYAPYIERTHPMLIPLASALGLTEQQVDQAFIDASIL